MRSLKHRKYYIISLVFMCLCKSTCCFIPQPKIVDKYFSESSHNVKLVNVTLRNALHLVRVSALHDKIQHVGFE